MPLTELVFDQTTREQVKFSFPCKTTLYRDAEGNHVLVGKRFHGEGKGDGVVLATWAIEALQSLPLPDHKKQVFLQNMAKGWDWKGLLAELPDLTSLPTADLAKHGPSNIIVVEPGHLDLKSMDYTPPPSDRVHRYGSYYERPENFFAPEEVLKQPALPDSPTALPIERAESLDLRAFLRAVGRNHNWLPNVGDLTALARAGGYTIVIDNGGFRAYRHG